MKLGVVARCLNTEHIRGMGRYLYELLARSPQVPELSWHLLADDPRHGLVRPEGIHAEVDIFSFRGDRFHMWEQVGLPARVRRLDLDLLHCTEGSLPLWQPIPTIVTLHDTLAWEEREHGFQSALYFDKLLPSALKRCAAVITISESSRHDILARWPWLESKLHVIPHGIDEAYFEKDGAAAMPEALTSALGSSQYLMYVGGPMERKRFAWAVDVLASCPQHSLKLVACGFGAAARAQARARVPQELQDRVVFAPFLSDQELRAVYQQAAAVLYPTLYEGFGFPAIEAQASGVPAIFSPVSSLRELIGPMTLQVDPHDLQAWVAAVQSALEIGSRKTELAAQAQAWARQFSWQHSFERHLDVYQRVIRSHKR